MKLFLVDGNSYIHRAYHALPVMITTKGEQVNAVYGFIRMILKILKKDKPDFLIICLDHPSKTFRHAGYADYKATRKETDSELKSQFPIVREFLAAFNVKYFEKEGYEADDLIATIAKKAGENSIKTIVVSGDKDILQLVDDSVEVLNEGKKILFTKEKVLEEYGVNPKQLADVFTIAGDAVDNIKGIKGIGEKTAVKLIAEHGSLENLISNTGGLSKKLADDLNSSRELIEMNRMLVRLDDKVPVDIDFEEARAEKINFTNAFQLLRRYEFMKLIDEIAAKADISSCEGSGFRIITSRDDFDGFIKKLSGAEAFSFEILSENEDAAGSPAAGISFTLSKQDSYYFPLSHNYLGCPEQLKREFLFSKLKDVFENENIKKYAHDIKRFAVMLKKLDIALGGINFDTSIASYCLNPSGKSHALNSLSVEYLNSQLISIDAVVKKEKGLQEIGHADINNAAKYSCMNSSAVFCLVEVLKKKLEEKNLYGLFAEMEMPLIEILAGMEMAGIEVDKAYLDDLSGEFEKLLRGLEKDIYGISGAEFNINSPKQLAFIMFDKMKMQSSKKTKTGFSTGEEVLKSLESSSPLPGKILEYRELQKLKSTYIDVLLKSADSESRIHTTFNQAVTATGRLSSTEPNLQNIPVKTEIGRKIRKAFVSKQGCVFISGDYSQIDLRSLAHLSGDVNLVKAFNRGEDIHNSTASEIFEVPVDKVTPELRRIAKVINFGIIYGMSAYGLAQTLNIPQGKAQEYIEGYLKKYSGVKAWMDNTIKTAREKKYVTTFMNRIRYLNEIDSKNPQVRNFAERIALNAPVQGTSADIIKAAMIKLKNKLEEKKMKTRMLIQVHDDLLFEAPEDEVVDAVASIKYEMENAVKLSVPVLVDMKKGKNWRDMEKI